MTTVASSTGCSEQSLSWILNASTHGNLAAEAIRIDLGYAWQVPHELDLRSAWRPPDHSQDSAMVLIDHQPTQIATVLSMDK